MRLYTVERGTLWVLETGHGLPPERQPRVEAAFAEAGVGDSEELLAAMNAPARQVVQARFQAGRRCFSLKVGSDIAAYGWVTQGIEYVGELERHFYFGDGEAYIWDCATLANWRGQGFYTALLSQIARQLQGEGVRRVWIGASRLNQPSLRGFASAGFGRVLDLTYRRFYRFTLMLLRPAGTPGQPLFHDARQILLNGHERRIGPVVVGFYDGASNDEQV
jgi:GNAT superfamily N-acetyltransferase